MDIKGIIQISNKIISPIDTEIKTYLINYKLKIIIIIIIIIIILLYQSYRSYLYSRFIPRILLRYNLLPCMNNIHINNIITIQCYHNIKDY